MATFLRIIREDNKHDALKQVCKDYRNNYDNPLNFEVDLNYLILIPGKPMAYWVSKEVYGIFSTLPKFETKTRFAKKGLDTGDNFRFLRLFWEIININKWKNHAKGGSFSKFYSDIHMIINLNVYKNK